MKIYTSYFANWRKFPLNARVLGITRFPFAHLPYPNEKLLAPSEELLADYKAGKVDAAEFTKRFVMELKGRGFTNGKDLAASLARASNGEDLILCCYEKKGEFCHRHILAEILRPYVEVEEL